MSRYLLTGRGSQIYLYGDLTDEEREMLREIESDNFIQSSVGSRIWDRLLNVLEEIAMGFDDMATAFYGWKSLMKRSHGDIDFYRDDFFDDMTPYYRKRKKYRQPVSPPLEDGWNKSFEDMDPAYRYSLGNVHLFSATPTRMFRYSLGFGNSEIQRGIGLPPGIANQDPEQFGRLERFIEVDHPGFGNGNRSGIMIHEGGSLEAKEDE